MQPSDLIALGAFLVAALTALWTLRLQRAVWRLQRRKLEREEDVLQRARLRIRSDSSPKKDVLYIENIGGGTAREVSLKIPCGNSDDMITPQIRRRYLPFDEIPPGTEVTLPVIFGGRCRPPLPADVTWTDPDGTSKEATIRILPA